MPVETVVEKSENTFVPADTQETVDLSYNSSPSGDGFIETDSGGGESFSFDSQDFNSTISDDGFTTTTSADKDDNTNNTSNQKEGESALMDLFK